VVSSFPQEQRAQLVAPDGSTSNVYQFQDLTKTNFVTMPVGKATLMFDKKDWRVDVRVREERVTV
jgi:predicted DNA binding CopG/RHH family protein